jgi:hypothetical protein
MGLFYLPTNTMCRRPVEIIGILRSRRWGLGNIGLSKVSRFTEKRLDEVSVFLGTAHLSYVFFSVIDSSAKIESGVLDGNSKWLGSYDECFNLEVPVKHFVISPIETQFCFAHIPLKLAYIPLEVGYDSEKKYQTCFANLGQTV